MENITITISKATDEEGYFYDIYDIAAMDIDESTESLDGGFCTTTIENAIDMAVEQAKQLLANK